MDSRKRNSRNDSGDVFNFEKSGNPRPTSSKKGSRLNASNEVELKEFEDEKALEDELEALGAENSEAPQSEDDIFGFSTPTSKSKETSALPKDFWELGSSTSASKSKKASAKTEKDKSPFQFNFTNPSSSTPAHQSSNSSFSFGSQASSSAPAPQFSQKTSTKTQTPIISTPSSAATPGSVAANAAANANPATAAANPLRRNPRRGAAGANVNAGNAAGGGNAAAAPNINPAIAAANPPRRNPRRGAAGANVNAGNAAAGGNANLGNAGAAPAAPAVNPYVLANLADANKIVERLPSIKHYIDSLFDLTLSQTIDADMRNRLLAANTAQDIQLRLEALEAFLNLPQQNIRNKTQSLDMLNVYLPRIREVNNVITMLNANAAAQPNNDIRFYGREAENIVVAAGQTAEQSFAAALANRGIQPGGGPVFAVSQNANALTKHGALLTTRGSDLRMIYDAEAIGENKEIVETYTQQQRQAGVVTTKVHIVGNAPLMTESKWDNLLYGNQRYTGGLFQMVKKAIENHRRFAPGNTPMTLSGNPQAVKIAINYCKLNNMPYVASTAIETSISTNELAIFRNSTKFKGTDISSFENKPAAPTFTP